MTNQNAQEEGDDQDRPSRREANHGGHRWCHRWPHIATLATQAVLLTQAVLNLLGR
jgi:hypothetical protein